MTQLLAGESGIAGTLFYGAIIVVVLWESLRPIRPLAGSILIRWGNNIALAALNIAILFGTIGFIALAAAEVAQSRGWGLLNAADLPGWAALAAGVLWIDLISYGTHRLMHNLPLLWRVHRVHHSDPDLDFTTSRRHHPFEILVTVPLTALAILVMGAPVLSLLLWAAVSGAVTVLHHGNVRIPEHFDRILRLAVVTPNMHRIHHSAHQPETDSNYSQMFPWWDRMFGTYVSHPIGGDTGMTIGLDEFSTARDQYLDRLLLQPFIRRPAPAARAISREAG